MMKKEDWKSEIIEFIEGSSDEDNLKIAVFIAGMRAQKKINLSIPQEKKEKNSVSVLQS